MTEEEEVRAATLRFYNAIEDIFVGRGVEAMKNAWHHTPEISSSHPFGPWSYGWEEIWATWVECAHLAKPGNGGMSLRDLRVRVYGELAYTTAVFVAAPALGGVTMNVTNILQRRDGEWKIIHHHADKTPSVETKLNELAEELG